MAFGGKLRFTFDPSVISEEEVLRLAVLSPNHDDVADYYLAPAVEGCVEGSPEYLHCGDRRPTAENFYRNAEVNLSKGRRKLAELNQFHVPPELLPVIHFMKESFGFTRWVQESRLAYFRSGGSLPGRYHDVDFSGPCSAIIRETVQARSPEERYAAAFKWQSCVNGEFRGRRGLKGTRSGLGTLPEGVRDPRKGRRFGGLTISIFVRLGRSHLTISGLSDEQRRSRWPQRRFVAV